MSDRTRSGPTPSRAARVEGDTLVCHDHERSTSLASRAGGGARRVVRLQQTAADDAPRGDGDRDPGAGGRAKLDAERMLSLLETLASDDLGGRFTLSDDIVSSAKLVSERWAASGVKPVGDSYSVPFSLVTGVVDNNPPTMSVTNAKGKAVTAAGETFVALPSSGSGKVEGEAVFVGYAAQAKDEDGNVVYDDLAGLDLKGKVAVVLLEAPARPSFREFFSEVGELIGWFEEGAGALRDKDNVAAMKKRHVVLRTKIAKLAEPFLRGKPMPKDYLSAPKDPMESPRSATLTAPILFHSRSLPGPTFERSETRDSTKIERLIEAGAVGVIMVKGPRTFVTRVARKRDELPSSERGGRPVRTAYDVPVVRMTWREADRVLRAGKKLSQRQKAIDTKLEPSSAPLGLTVALSTDLKRETAEIPNVLGMIPGGEKADEIVLIGAHYDHIGRDETGAGHCRAKGEGDTKDDICNGADDNGSGTVVVVELAQALAESGVTPKRTLVFALFAGEELGLLGSAAMASELPKATPFDEGKIVAMINIDMVGRLRPELGLAVGGVGSSSGWMPLLDGIDGRGMPIVFDKAVTTRSDHASFYKQDIPVLFFFTHVHDDYHGPGDEMSLINRDGMGTIAHYVLDITRRVADGHALPFTPPGNPDEGLVGALPGDNPKTIVKRVGFPEAAPESAPADPEAAEPVSGTDTPVKPTGS